MTLEYKKTLPIILIFIVIGIFSAFIITATVKKEKSENPNKNILLRLVHPPELSSYLSSVMENFLSTDPKLYDGTKIKIKLISENSVIAAQRIASGDLKTDMAISSSTLINYTNSQLINLGPKQIDCTQIFATPMVLAVKASDLSLFDSKNRSVSLNNIMLDNIRFSDQNKESTTLNFNHGNPVYSSTGLASLIQLAYIAAGKSEQLTETDINNPSLFNNLAAYQNFAAGYSFDEVGLLKVVAHPASKVQFSITSEQQLASFNSRLEESLTPLVALYPSEGSYWIDYNVCTSDADWVSAAHRVAAKLFLKYLSDTVSQNLAKEKGFRPSIVSSAASAPLTKEFGIDTSLPKESLLPLPATVSKKILDKWQTLVKPYALLLVLDTSASMEGASLRIGKNEFNKILARSSWRDLSALMTFANETQLLADFSSDNKKIYKELESAQAIGGSAIFDALKKSFEIMSATPLDGYRKTIVFFTDADDKNSDSNIDSLVDYLQNSRRVNNINLIIVTINNDSDLINYKKITRATNAILKIGSLDEMEKIFTEISANL